MLCQTKEQLEVSECRIRHLTGLLTEAERDLAKLTQQNQVLKEEIRRQQRSVEREQHAQNFEYLKNVVLKVSDSKNVAVKQTYGKLSKVIKILCYTEKWIMNVIMLIYIVPTDLRVQILSLQER